MSILGFGLWASSGPFPLSAHYGLYKRGRDPPTNPSRHLKKEKRALPLKWLLKEDQGRRPTAASAPATAAAPPRAAAMPAAETAASPCLGHVSPVGSLPVAAVAAAIGRRHCHRRKAAPPSLLLHRPFPYSPPPPSPFSQSPFSLPLPPSLACRDSPSPRPLPYAQPPTTFPSCQKSPTPSSPHFPVFPEPPFPLT